MKLGTLKNGRPDGQLVVVSRDNQIAREVPEISLSLLNAIENWDEVSPKLEDIYRQLNLKKGPSFKVDEKKFLSPLPRTYQWLDGSAFIQHIILVRKARGAPIPETLKEIPLMYQGVSDNFLAPYEDIPLIEDSHGMDFEGEVGVVLGKVPMGTTSDKALDYVKLVTLINDVSLRGLVPGELAMGFGFLQSKPPSAHAPFVVTPDELGEFWKDGKIHLPLQTELNGKWFGNPNAGEMFFSFGQLISHAAKTRPLGPGTIIGSGTVSNEDEQKGSSCLVEKRMLEKIKTGEFKTPFMSPGDSILMKMELPDGNNIFGNIHQTVVKFRKN